MADFAARIAERPDPVLYFLVVFPLSLLVLWLGYRYAVRGNAQDGENDAWAFGVAQASIFGLIALILGFSFSFAVGRFEERRALVVSEAKAIRTAYLRGGFLSQDKAVAFRATVVEYAKIRLTAYDNIGDAQTEREALAKGDELQGVLWTAAASAAKRDPRSIFNVDLTRSVIELVDIAEQQQAALNNHIPRAVIGIVLLGTLIGAFLLGLTFGRAKSPNVLLSGIFCLLFAATVSTIIDLDHPQSGFIRIDTAPLQTVLEDITKETSSHLIRAPVQ